MVDEAFGVDQIGGVKDCLSLDNDFRGLPVVQRRGRWQADAGAEALVVVPGKEIHSETSGVLH
jgi:hypothetical protein